jgi:hypothetical protein
LRDITNSSFGLLALWLDQPWMNSWANDNLTFNTYLKFFSFVLLRSFVAQIISHTWSSLSSTKPYHSHRFIF